MSPKLLLLALIALAMLFPLALIGGWFAPRLAQALGSASEAPFLVGLLASVALIVWMFAHCATNSGLSRQDKNRWYGFLLIGGPIAAALYLWAATSQAKTSSHRANVA